MSDGPSIRIKRIYDPPAEDDGFRVLVDRLWPGGVKKDDAQINLWAKEIAPTTELRKWFDHDPGKFDEFKARYAEELRATTQLLANIIDGDHDVITLLYGARDRECNHAVVLHEFLSG